MKIVIVNGYSGCGKDTFVQTVGEMVSVKSYSVADTAKEMAYEEHDLDDSCKGTDDEPFYRQFLINRVNELIENGTIEEEIREVIKRATEQNFDILFIHNRDNTAANLIHDKLGLECVTLWLQRDSVDPSNDQDAGAAHHRHDMKVILPDKDTKEYDKVVHEVVSFILDN